LGNIKISIVLSIFISTSITTALHSQDDFLQLSKIYYGVEYLFPVAEDRNIKTYNIDVFYPVSEFKQIHFSVFAGVTFTYATGDITQLEGELNEGTLREVNYKNSAFGIGPGLMIGWEFLLYQNFSIHIEGIGNIIIYNENFPAGGAQYNFMWRGGPLLQYIINKSNTIGLGYNWAHISNGKGMVPENPSYDAEGVCIRFTVLF
jgi:lipid A 3-O-deacylase